MFWKRKKQQTIELLDNPRRHHYMYAHQILRGFCNEGPIQFFSYIASEEKDVFTGFIWNKVREYYDSEEHTTLNADDFVFSCLRLGNSPTILVEMPQPRAITEALFIAIVLLGDANDDSPPDDPQTRYFTLELGHDPLTPYSQIHAVIGEWIEEQDPESGGIHLNYGQAKGMDPQGFLTEVERLITDHAYGAQKLLMATNVANNPKS